MLESLSKRLRDRPDSEHEQAIVRLGMVFFLGAYLSIIGNLTPFDHGSYWLTMIVASAYLTLSVVYIALICIWPAPSPIRRLAAMVTDMTTMGLVIHFAGTSGAAIYPVYLWVTFGNGFRYGNRYLAASALGSIVSFGLVVAFTDFWLNQPYLSAGLLLALLVLPAYVSSLIRKLTEAKAQAEEASVAKSRFLATMSHELRTPLNAIIGIGGLLQKTSLNAEQSDMTRTIGASARALLSLIDRILDFSRIEAGRMPLDVVDFDLYREVSDLERMIRPQALAKDLDLQILIDANTPPLVRGPTACMRHIVTNLAANAVKFTERGHVRISVTTGGDLAGRKSLRIDVIDAGIGISEEAVERIFDQFTQEDQAIARRYGGAGLGLAISKQLIDLVGGRLEVETKVGHGSRFWVELPYEPVADAAALGGAVEAEQVTPIWIGRPPAQAGEAGVRDGSGRLSPAVVVDSLEDALTQRNAMASRGQNALIVEHEPKAQSKAIDPVIVTADGFDALGMARSWSGVRCVLVGDVNARQLSNAAHCYRAFGRAGAGMPAASPIEKERAPNRSLSILVAEDNPVNRRVIAMILRRASHKVDMAVNGDEASESLAAKRYDIAILDVNMPGISGIDVVRLLRFQELGGQRTPVLALTADATDVTRETCLSAGMDAVITKPVEPERLLEAVHGLTATEMQPEVAAEQQGQVAEPAASGVVEDAGQVTDLTAHPRFRSGQTAVIDAHAVEGLAQLDETGHFLREVIDEFLTDADQLLDTMAASAAERDVGALRDNAHALKSSAAHVGALRMQSICSAFQRASRRDNAANGETTVETLREELAVYRTAIENELRGRGEEDQRL